MSRNETRAIQELVAGICLALCALLMGAACALAKEV